MRSKYLKILGLQPGASKKDVKASFRRLSKKYHPDVNKDDGAGEKFVMISEAYNFLMGKGSQVRHPETRASSPVSETPYRQWKSAARRKAWERAEESKKTQSELIGRILKRFQYALIFILSFNVLLSVDYLLPLEEHDQAIIGVRKIFESGGQGFSNYHRYDELVFDEFIMRFDQNEVIRIKDYESAKVYATPIFRKPMSTKIIVAGTEMIFRQSINVYTVLGYFIPSMFFLIGTYYFGLRTLDQKLTMALCIVILFVIQFVYFI